MKNKIVLLSLIIFGGFSFGCQTLRPDYNSKLTEETSRLEKMWEELNRDAANHKSKVKAYIYQSGYVQGLATVA